MVKATLRKAKPIQAVVEVEAQVVETTEAKSGVKKTTNLAKSGVKKTTNLAESVPDDEGTGEAGESAKPASKAVARAPKTTQAIGVPREPSAFAGGAIEGDWGQDDLKFPQLKIVQGSGPLSEKFDNGTIILSEEHLLDAPSVKPGAKNTPIRFVPVHIKKQFREKLAQDAIEQGEMPRIFNSVQEVEDAGLTTKWIGSDRPDNYAEPSARVIMLVELPEGSDHPDFVHEIDGKMYAVAVCYAAGGSFREFPRLIFQNLRTSLLVPVVKDGKVQKDELGRIVKVPMMWKCFWTLEFAKKKVGEFMVWRPKVRVAEETSGAVRAFASEVMGAPAEAVESDD